MMGRLQAALEQGAVDLGLALTETQSASLLAYLELLQKWGRVYNLTAVRDPDEMLTYHLLDCLAVIGPLRREIGKLGVADAARLLDVGSGAGLPGVVISVCCPGVFVTCVDTVAKKTAFVQQVAATLRLPNLRAIHARVENLTEPYDIVVSRAFASLADFTQCSANALAPGGVWAAMKGKYSEEEIAGLPPSLQVFHVEQLQVPGLEAQRCLVWIRQRPAA